MSAPVGKKNCFVCQGEGKIWPFEGKRGIPKECKVCKGSKYIDDYLIICPHCNGTNKIYDADDGKGFPKDCKLCNKNGYIDFLVTPCSDCDHTGRKWPFENKR